MIPIKIIREECITLSDEFVVELVETLASEMNPDTVCSVAGTYASSSYIKLGFLPGGFSRPFSGGMLGGHYALKYTRNPSEIQIWDIGK